jgi:hypothetical protein
MRGMPGDICDYAGAIEPLDCNRDQRYRDFPSQLKFLGYRDVDAGRYRGSKGPLVRKFAWCFLCEC